MVVVEITVVWRWWRWWQRRWWRWCWKWDDRNGDGSGRSGGEVEVMMRTAMQYSQEKTSFGLNTSIHNLHLPLPSSMTSEPIKQ